MRDSSRQVAGEPPPLRPRSSAVLLRGESISLARRAAATAKKRREEARAELERRGVREGVENALSTIVGASASTRANVSQNKAKRTKRVKWTGKEVQALRDGVAQYGEGRWAVILREFASEFNPVRISVDLKDKWRNLFKSQSRNDDDNPEPVKQEGVEQTVEHPVENAVQQSDGHADHQNHAPDHQQDSQQIDPAIQSEPQIPPEHPVEGGEQPPHPQHGKAESVLRGQLEDQLPPQQQQFPHVQPHQQPAIPQQQHQFDHPSEEHQSPTHTQQQVYSESQTHAEQIAHAQPVLNDQQIEHESAEQHIRQAQPMASAHATEIPHEPAPHHQEAKPHPVTTPQHTNPAQYAQQFSAALQGAREHPLTEQMTATQYHRQQAAGVRVNQTNSTALAQQQVSRRQMHHHQAQELAQHEIEQQQVEQQQLLSIQQTHQSSTQQVLAEQQLSHHQVPQHGHGHVEHEHTEEPSTNQHQQVDHQELEPSHVHHDHPPDQQNFQPDVHTRFHPPGISHQQIEQPSLQHHEDGEAQVGKSELQEAHVQAQPMGHHAVEQPSTGDGTHSGQGFAEHHVATHQLEHGGLPEHHSQGIGASHAVHEQVNQQSYHDGQAADQYNAQGAAYDAVGQSPVATEQLAQEGIARHGMQQQRFEGGHVTTEQALQPHNTHAQNTIETPNAGPSVQIEGDHHMTHQQRFVSDGQANTASELESREDFRHSEHIEAVPAVSESVSQIPERGEYNPSGTNDVQLEGTQQFCNTMESAQSHHGNQASHVHGSGQMAAQHSTAEQNTGVDDSAGGLDNEAGAGELQVPSHNAVEAHAGVMQGVGVGVDSTSSFMQEQTTENGDHIAAPQPVLEDHDASASVFEHPPTSAGGHEQVQPHGSLHSHAQTEKSSAYVGQYPSGETGVLRETHTGGLSAQAESYSELKGRAALDDESGHNGKPTARFPEVTRVDVLQREDQNDQKPSGGSGFSMESSGVVDGCRGVASEPSVVDLEIQTPDVTDSTDRRTSFDKIRTQSSIELHSEQPAEVSGGSLGQVNAPGDVHVPSNFVTSDPNLLGCVISQQAQEHDSSAGNEAMFANPGAFDGKLDNGEGVKDSAPLVQSNENVVGQGTGNCDLHHDDNSQVVNSATEASIEDRAKVGEVAGIVHPDQGGTKNEAGESPGDLGEHRIEGFGDGQVKEADPTAVSQANEESETLYDGEKATCTLDNDDGGPDVSQLDSQEVPAKVQEEGSFALKRRRSGAAEEDYSSKRQATEGKAVVGSSSILDAEAGGLDINGLQSSEG